MHVRPRLKIGYAPISPFWPFSIIGGNLFIRARSSCETEINMQIVTLAPYFAFCIIIVYSVHQAPGKN